MSAAPAIAIRRCVPGDAVALYGIFHASVHGLASRHYNPQQCAVWAPEAFDEVAWSSRIKRNQPYVALVDGQRAGFADLQSDGYIDQFFVHPAYAGRGVGSALLAFVLKQARVQGVEQLRSHVSITAQPLFARHGFSIAQQQTVQLGGLDFNNAVMICDLR